MRTAPTLPYGGFSLTETPLDRDSPDKDPPPTEKAFQKDVYRPPANCHQMSVPAGRRDGPQVYKFEQAASDGHQMSVAIGWG